MKKSPKQSPAMQMLALTWRGTNSAAAHSWERVNHAMSMALELVISYGFLFDEADFKSITEQFRPHYWMQPDWVYRMAVTGGRIGKHTFDHGDLVASPHNMSAVKSMEANGHPSWMLRGHRLFVGARLCWMEEAHAAAVIRAGKHPSAFFNDSRAGLHVKVTSITSERVVLSHYHNAQEGAPKRILKITREKLAAQNELLKPPAKKKPKVTATP
jgi:hypothetical protein